MERHHAPGIHRLRRKRPRKSLPVQGIAGQNCLVRRGVRPLATNVHPAETARRSLRMNWNICDQSWFQDRPGAELLCTSHWRTKVQFGIMSCSLSSKFDLPLISQYVQHRRWSSPSSQTPESGPQQLCPTLVAASPKMVPMSARLMERRPTSLMRDLHARIIRLDFGYLLNDAPGSPMSPPRGPMGGGAFIVAWRGTIYVTPAHTSP